MKAFIKYFFSLCFISSLTSFTLYSQNFVEDAFQVSEIKNDNPCSQYGHNDGYVKIGIPDDIPRGDEGVPPYRFELSTGEVHNEYDHYPIVEYQGLAPGDYTLTITDGQGRSITVTFTIGYDDLYEITLDYSLEEEECGLFTATLVVTDGYGRRIRPFLFYWSPFTSWDIWDRPDHVAFTKTGLAPGIHHIEISNIDGCRSLFEIVVPESQSPFTIDAEIVDEVSCDGSVGGTISVTISEPEDPTSSNYTWSNSQGDIVGSGIGLTTMSDLPPGVYTIEVVSPKGCTATVTIELSDLVNDTPLEVELVIESQVVRKIQHGDNSTHCIAKVRAIVTGGVPNPDLPHGYTFNWDNYTSQSGMDFSQVIVDNNPVTVGLIVTDSRGCEVTASITINPCDNTPIDNGGGGNDDTQMIIYPNPNNGDINVSVALDVSNNINIDIISTLTGATVFSQDMGWQAAGTTVYPINGTSFPDGYYMVNVTAGSNPPVSELMLKH